MTVLRAAVAGLRAVVLLLVVLVGMSVSKNYHGLKEATLLCKCFPRDCGVDFLRFRVVHAENIDQIRNVGIPQPFEVSKS